MIGKKRVSPKGFTLIELLIVIIVLGVLTSLAVPMYRKSIEKVRKTEALEALSAVRRSQLRFYSQNQTFTLDMSLLDFNPDESAALQTVHFTYEVTAADAAGFVATATRNTVNGGDGSSTVTINEAGKLAGTFGLN